MAPRIAPLDPPYPAGMQAQFDKLLARPREHRPASEVHGGPADECWGTEERLVMRLADQLHDTSRVDDPLWTELSGRFAADQLVELIVLAGLYHAVSFATNAIGIEQEVFAPRFPSLPD